MAVTREEVVWAYKSILDREPESDDLIAAHISDHETFSSLREALLKCDEFKQNISRLCNLPKSLSKYRKRDDRPTILVQNFHRPATAGLIRDLTKAGLRVLCPAAEWSKSFYGGENDGLGGELITYDDYMGLNPGRVLVACLFHEQAMTELARAHGDEMILNVAQHRNYYSPNISDVLICPDIITYEEYPSHIEKKLLYFPRPFMAQEFAKDTETSYRKRLLCTYINMPEWFPHGAAALDSFMKRCPYTVRRYGHGAPDGALEHAECNRMMAESMFTIHFKEHEAYGLSCIESMMIGTPVVSLRHFMYDKTLGRFFLTDENSITADSIEEAAERIEAIDYETYCRMSRNCTKQVMELTSEANTVDRLRDAMFENFVKSP